MIDKIKDGKRFTIGAIDLFDFDPVNKRAGIGIMIIRGERKKGFASDALTLLIDYCFKTLRLHQVYCNIDITNQASYNLFLKHHFKVIGLKKDWLRVGNNWVDEYILQLIHSI